VTLDLLDDVFLLHLALKATQCILEGLSLLQSDFCQLATPPNRSRLDPIVIASFEGQVKSYISSSRLDRLAADSSAADEVSENQSQSELHLPGSVGVGGPQRVRRYLVMSWEIIDSKLFSGFYELS
jgi:hypothetical protein